MLVFDKKYLGTPKHLMMLDRGVRWVDEKDQFAFGGGTHVDLQNLVRIFDPQLKFLPPRYEKMCEQLNCQFDARMMETTEYRDCVSRLSDRVRTVLSTASVSGYLDVWKQSRSILDALLPAPASRSNLNRIRNEISGEPIKFKTFIKTIKRGSFENIKYHQNKTKTGRLTVASGPNILTMPTEWKSAVEDAYQVDFVSMEPMLLIAISNGDRPDDVYDWIKNKLNLKISRSRTKILTIISMYGGKDNETTRKIDDLLQIPYWIKRIKAEKANNIIFNYFGRPITCDDNISDRHMFALWLQSSAVDASLLGFANLCKQYSSIKPHWVIHDGLLFTGGKVNITDIFINKDITLPVTVEKL
jgi:hypothetical protein